MPAISDVDGKFEIMNDLLTHSPTGVTTIASKKGKNKLTVVASPGTTLSCFPATGRLRRSSPTLSSINVNFHKWELASVNLHICISHCHYCQNLLKMLCKLFPSHFTQEVAHVSALHLLVRTSVQNTKSKEDFEIKLGK